MRVSLGKGTIASALFTVVHFRPSAAHSCESYELRVNLHCRLAAGSPNLSKLILQNCLQVTNDGLMAIADSCFVLEHLDLTGCRDLDDASLLGFVSSSLRWRRITTVSQNIQLCTRMLNAKHFTSF